jgi:predicted dehydrogenase
MEIKNKILRIGFIGGSIDSAIGTSHKIASQMDGKWKLVAGCFSRNSEINKETGDVWGIRRERIYASADSLFEGEKGELDAVVILTPTPTHYSLVTQALDSGFHVICEKSLASTSDEISKILACQKRNKRFLAVTFNYSGYPMIRELKSRIQRGEFGQIMRVQAEMPQEGFIRVDGDGKVICPQKWRLSDGLIPTVSLDLGVHLHHLIHFLTGEKPEEVVATQSNVGLFGNIIDDVSCLVKYTGKMESQIWYGKVALGQRNGLVIKLFGKKASGIWTQSSPEELYINYNDGKKECVERGQAGYVINGGRYNRFKSGHPAGFIEAFANLYTDLSTALMRFRQNGDFDTKYVFGASHALEGLKLFEAVSESSSKKQWVDI